MNKLPKVRGLVLLAMALSPGACRSAEPAAGDTNPHVVTVAVAPVSREAVSERLQLAAEFRPYQEVTVRARVSGYVQRITVDVGDRVQKNQVIAVLEAPEIKSELDEAEAARRRSEREVARGQSEVARAHSELDAARLVHSRLDGVARSNPNMIARQEVDDALARVRGAEAQLAAATAGLAAARESVRVQAAAERRAQAIAGFATVDAPFAGLISARHSDPGDMVPADGGAAGRGLVQLSQVDPLRLTLAIPESVAPGIEVGRVLQVSVPALHRVFDGRVARVTGRVDPHTRTMETQVDVANPGGTLMPGMHAVVEVVVAHNDSALMMPVQALSRQGERPVAMVVNAEHVLELRDVVTGIETPSSVEIVSGLSDGDLVVIGGISQLEPGQRVTPKKTRPAAVPED